MITVDTGRCIKCGKCTRTMKKYCISEQDGYPVFDHSLCNTCQKCVTICPVQAIMVNNTYPDKIAGNDRKCSPEALGSLFERRRSIKHFQDRPIPGPVIQEIVSVAKYAPNQNKNISILVVDNQELIAEIDREALSMVRIMYRLLFGFKPVTAFVKLFSKEMDTIKRKMEYDLFDRKQVVKKNTQALIILTGDRKVPVTENSAHYVLATVMYMAEALEIGNCLMDSLLYTLNMRKKLKKRLNIQEHVLGVLSLGYSDENIVNIPRGYEVDIKWN